MDTARISTDSVRAALPDPSIPADSTRVASVVLGLAELWLEQGSVAPADYLRASLEGEGGRFETLTDRSGQFFFQNVPAGRYRLVFSTSAKMPRDVFELSVVVHPGSKFQVPPVHIPLDSLKRGGG